MAFHNATYSKFRTTKSRGSPAKNDLEKAAQILKNEYPNIKLLLVSLGKDGSRAYSGNAYAYAPIAKSKNSRNNGRGRHFLRRGTYKSTRNTDFVIFPKTNFIKC